MRVSLTASEVREMLGVYRSIGKAPEGTFVPLAHAVLELLDEIDSRDREKSDTLDERTSMQAEIKNLKHQLTLQRNNNYARNVALDALHFVWCDGGCETGVHRYEHPGSLTQEIVDAAVRNTKRLVSWWGSSEFKTLSIQDRWQYFAAVREHEALRAALVEHARRCYRADCDKIATYSRSPKYNCGSAFACDEHAKDREDAVELPHAAILRTLNAGT